MNTKKFKAEDKVGIKGEYTAFSIHPSIRKGSKILVDLREAIRTGNEKIIKNLMFAGVITNVQTATNIIPTTGRNVLARLLTGDPTYSGEIDYGALGDAVSPVFTNSSTTLVNETFRSQADSQAFDDNITYIDWFIASGDVADGTFTEFGAFIDGTGAADSGQAWSLLATGGWVKSGSMFISAKYTLV